MLGVAIGYYEDGNILELPGVLKDAERLRSILWEYRDAEFADFHWLQNNMATQEEILKKIAEIAESALQADQVIIYLAGHGYEIHGGDAPNKDGMTRYFMPYDASPKNITQKGISTQKLKEALEQIVASEIVLIIDFCYGGSLVNSSFLNTLNILTLGYNNRFVMASALPFQEVKDTSQGGFFVQYLCDALEGEADRNADLISAQAAYEYAAQRMSSLRPQERLYQCPIYFGIGQSIFLTKVTTISGKEKNKFFNAVPNANERTWSKYWETVFARTQKWRTLSIDRDIDIEEIYITHYIEDKKESFSGIRKGEILSDDDVLKKIYRDEFKNHHAYIVGPPGSGKTTLCRRWTRTLIKNAYFPLMISLPQIVQQFLTGRSNITLPLLVDCLFLHHFDRELINSFNELIQVSMENDKCILLLDGFDEVPKDYKGKLLEWIRAWSQDFEGIHVIVFSRPPRAQLTLPNFEHFEVEPFSITQINKFIDKWFTKEMSEARKTLKSKVKENPELCDICSNPLFLTYVCSIFDHLEDFGSESIDEVLKRENLIPRLVKILLEELEEEKFKPRLWKFSSNLKIRILEDVAYDFFRDAKYTFFDNELIEKITQSIAEIDIREKIDDVELLIREIELQSGILRRAGWNQYQFSHHSFMEYFCARKMMREAKNVGIYE
jgi:energy-coupling factor transporter ATP-binding protein EcfA2